MTILDRALQYQFVAFTHEPTEGTELPDLAAILETPVVGVENLGLKLRPAPEAQFSIMVGGAMQSSQGRSWNAASGMWRINWSAERIDVVFNAQGYAEVRENAPPSLDIVRKRIAGNLLRLCEVAGQRVKRVAAIVTGEASCPDRNVQKVVASLFLNAEAQQAADRGMAVDLMARTNLQEPWSFKGLKEASTVPVRVNRLQSATAVGVLRGNAFDTYLSVQIDVNTDAQLDLSAAVDQRELAGFFDRAVVWTNDRLKAFEDAACRR